MFSPTFVDIGIFIGTLGFFFVLFLLYARTFPVIAQAEVKSILKASGSKYKKLRAEQGDDAKHYEMPAGGKVAVEKLPWGRCIWKNQYPFENNIGAFDAATQQADDLKRISGVGPKWKKNYTSLAFLPLNR